MRSYDCVVTIRKFNADKLDAIVEAAREEWDFEDEPNTSTDEIFLHGQGQICAGVSDDQAANAITHAVWKANGGYCEVDIRLLYLDDLPWESYQLYEDDYDEWIDNKSGEDES